MAKRQNLCPLCSIDTLSNVHCARVIKSNNEQLNVKVIEIIKGAKFTPAINRSKKVIALMVLPITFGEPPPKKKGKK